MLSSAERDMLDDAALANYQALQTLLQEAIMNSHPLLEVKIRGILLHHHGLMSIAHAVEDAANLPEPVDLTEEQEDIWQPSTEDDEALEYFENRHMEDLEYA